MEHKIILEVSEAKDILNKLDKNSKEYSNLKNKVLLSEGKVV